MYTVKANTPIKQYYFYFGPQCPWAIFDLIEMLYSHVCKCVYVPHAENAFMNFLSLIRIKGREKIAVSSLCDEVSVGVTRPNPHAITLHQGTSIVHDYFIAYN